MYHNFKDLKVYKLAFQLAMDIFQISNNFPKEELYSLTDQIRRSSRSVCINISEGYRKRKYPKYFVSKITDADMENAESQIWLDFAYACKYITEIELSGLMNKSMEIGRMLNHMIENPEKYNRKAKHQKNSK